MPNCGSCTDNGSGLGTQKIIVGWGWSEKGYKCTAAIFCKEMVSLFMAPTISMLSQPLDVGLCHHAMLTLLPPLIRAIQSLEKTINVMMLGEKPFSSHDVLKSFFRATPPVLSM
jgi:hypothetical protein